MKQKRCRRRLIMTAATFLTKAREREPISVTRFGKISPLWQNFTSLWANFDSLFLIWQNVEITLANLVHYWAKFHSCQRPNIEK